MKQQSLPQQEAQPAAPTQLDQARAALQALTDRRLALTDTYHARKTELDATGRAVQRATQEGDVAGLAIAQGQHKALRDIVANLETSIAAMRWDIDRATDRVRDLEQRAAVVRQEAEHSQRLIAHCEAEVLKSEQALDWARNRLAQAIENDQRIKQFATDLGA